MNLTSLRLFQFRNFANQEIELRPGLCFFVGRNGQGKTNLLEAVYLLSRGESFRPSQNEHFLNRNRAASLDRARIVASLDRKSVV